MTAAPAASPAVGGRTAAGRLPFRSYLECLGLAVLVETVILFFSVLPGLGTMGMRHSANAPRPGWEVTLEVIAFVLHLPTVLITWPLTELTGTLVVLLTPVTQVAFWAALFIGISRTRRARGART